MGRDTIAGLIAGILQKYSQKKEKEVKTKTLTLSITMLYTLAWLFAGKVLKVLITSLVTQVRAASLRCLLKFSDAQDTI